MVQIYIKISDSSAKLNEYTIIELQGDLEVENGQSLQNKFMADLHFNNEGIPILILGHHVMFGKVINLDKPIVLLKKTMREKSEKIFMDDDDQDQDEKINKNEVNMNEEDELDETKKATEYLIKAIIRKKFLFNKRPRPIVLNEFKRA